jgi:hypothetical protein
MGATNARQAAAILEIIAEVERIDASAYTRYRLKQFIGATCLAAGITILDRKERVQFARRLLDDGEPRPIIRDRLMARFGIKRASAYNAIDEALQLSKSTPKFWTNEAQTSITDSATSTLTPPRERLIWQPDKTL